MFERNLDTIEINASSVRSMVEGVQYRGGTPSI